MHHTLLDHSALTGSGGEESFYMFEADNSKVNSGSALDATCLVVQFLGGPASGWHRLDFEIICNHLVVVLWIYCVGITM